MISKLKVLNLALRGIMETSIIVALGYWGYQFGKSMGTKIMFGLGVPIIGFGFWGAVDFHQTGKFAEGLRLIQELVISGLAAVALYFSGQQTLGWMLGIISIIHHSLKYMTGEKLIKAR